MPPAPQTFVNLVTGATLPDSGDVAVFGQNTARHHRQQRVAAARSTASAW